MSSSFEVIEVSIEIEVPAAVVFERWTRFESFPDFMEGVAAVECTGIRQLRWHGVFGGQLREWDSTVTVWIPHRRLAWRSTSAGKHSSRAVCIEEAGAGRTRVTIKMLIDPDEEWARIPTRAQVSRRLRSNLLRLKTLLESKPSEN